MPSPFPGMDPYLEVNPIFQELHTQMLAEMQALLQPQLRPRYAARMAVEEFSFRKQRRIVIYVQDRPRLAVTGIELLSPGNKQSGAVLRDRYLEKRASALHGGLHWVEIDLLRGGERPPLPVTVPDRADYLSYVAQATPSGWRHCSTHGRCAIRCRSCPSRSWVRTRRGSICRNASRPLTIASRPKVKSTTVATRRPRR